MSMWTEATAAHSTPRCDDCNERMVYVSHTVQGRRIYGWTCVACDDAGQVHGCSVAPRAGRDIELTRWDTGWRAYVALAAMVLIGALAGILLLACEVVAR